MYYSTIGSHQDCQTDCSPTLLNEDYRFHEAVDPLYLQRRNCLLR